MADRPGPLSGLRVLDFTTTFSGPYCTQILAEMGADVIKIEAPGGDITRSLGTTRTPGMGSVFIASNRHKASAELDLKSDEARRTIHELIGRADCLVHNMRLPAAERLGIDADTAMAINSRLVHASITGYGSDGPYSGRPAYDDCIQAASGMAWLQSLVTQTPSYMASPVADKVTGLAAANAVMAALLSRERSGHGQAIEIPMFETLASFTLMEQWGGRAFVPPEGETGYARIRSPHRRPYKTADGLISVVVYHEGHWQRFLDFVGRAELLEQDRYRTTEARNRNIDDLYVLLEELIEERSTAEWLTILAKLDVPAMPIASLDDLFEDEHLQAVDFFHEIRDKEGQVYLASRPAVRFSETPLDPTGQAPVVDRLGAGNASIDRWLSLD